MEYLTGKDYKCCKRCKAAIDDAHMLIISEIVGEEYIDDNEGPSMLAYDNRWLCQQDCFEGEE